MATLLVFASCSSKPDTALCGKYYRHLLAIHETEGHPGALAGLKTGEAKNAVLAHCLELDRSAVECVLGSRTPGEATQCELSGGRVRAAAEPTGVLEFPGEDPATDAGFNDAEQPGYEIGSE